VPAGVWLGHTPAGAVTEAHITRTHTRTQDMLPHQANNKY
jgi:hypothetical protein